MTVLVTGGGGFLGKALVKQLVARGEQVRSFGRGDYPELSQMGVEVCRGDICDLRAVEAACIGVTVVFHVAAAPGYWGKWQQFYRPNVMGTQHLIGACRRQRVPKLVFTSSPSVVFDGKPHRHADESLPYPDKFESPYPHTKALAEQLVRAANGDDLLTVCLRPHLIFGPGDTHLLPRVIARAKQGRLIQVGDGQNCVDFTFVEDAARAHIDAWQALEIGSPLAGQAYFISQDAPIKLWPWINELLTQLAIPTVKRRIPLKLARTLGRILETIHSFVPGEPRLTRFLASELALDHFYSIERAKRDFNYQPKTSMETALALTVEDLRHR